MLAVDAMHLTNTSLEIHVGRSTEATGGGGQPTRHRR